MRVVALSTLRKFWEEPDYEDSMGALNAWHREAKHAEWTSPADIKAQYSYLENRPSLSAILWVDRCHPFVGEWIIDIVYNHNSNPRISCILEGEEYINGNIGSSHYRIYPKEKLVSCKQHEFYESSRELRASFESDPDIQ